MKSIICTLLVIFFPPFKKSEYLFIFTSVGTFQMTGYLFPPCLTSNEWRIKESCFTRYKIYPQCTRVRNKEREEVVGGGVTKNTKSPNEPKDIFQHRRKRISEVTVRQWVLFQQLRYDSLPFCCLIFCFFCTSHFYKVLANEERRGEEVHAFPTEGESLGIATGCCWCSAVAEHRDLTAKLRPNVASCCLNKTHCFSLPAKSYSWVQL